MTHRVFPRRIAEWLFRLVLLALALLWLASPPADAPKDATTAVLHGSLR